MRPSYFAKILLFGEYGIIKDAMGLSIPYRNYSGALYLPEEELTEAQRLSNQALQPYAEYLHTLSLTGELRADLNVTLLNRDIAQGLYFESSIPQGYGVGSSGALVAALYAQYAKNPLDLNAPLEPKAIADLKEALGQMESYFHGKSSGIDPTICYLQLPLLIKSKDDLGTVDLPAVVSEGKSAIFLLNSGNPGETQPMVNIFMEKLKEEGFRKMMSNQFNKYNDACVQAFLKSDWDPLFTNLKGLSRVALEHFSPMIPSAFHSLWQKGIDSNAYYLKLCGSGGGGYILGFTKDLDEARSALAPHKLDVVLRF
ncbi:MAG TPA: mevalonate kinase [Cryomorphaceae bacterium]|nr:mevalonate kinase [Cryomorphaceae bacterium]